MRKKILLYTLLMAIPILFSCLLTFVTYLYLKTNYVAASEFWICYTCPSSEFTWHGAVGARREFAAKIITNELGFNDRKLSYRKKVKNRILVVGDSFVESLQVNSVDSFGNLIEKKFEDTRIYMMGRSGWGQKDILDYLVAVKATKSILPKKVVITFFYHNDLWNNDENLKDRLYGVEGTKQPRPRSLLSNEFWRSNDLLGYIAYFSDLYDRISYAKVNKENTEWLIYTPNFINDPVMIGAIKKTRNYFLELKKYLQHSYAIDDRDFYILIIPTQYYLDEISGKEIKLPGSIPQQNYRYDQLHRAMKGMLEKLFNPNQIIDLADYVGCNGIPKNIHFRIDSHLNKDGHRTVACALERIINEE